MRPRTLVAFFLPWVLQAQASLEYAMKSSGSSLSSQGGSTAYIGACRVDGTILSCLSRSYPLAVAAVGAALFLLLLRKLLARPR